MQQTYNEIKSIYNALYQANGDKQIAYRICYSLFETGRTLYEYYMYQNKPQTKVCKKNSTFYFLPVNIEGKNYIYVTKVNNFKIKKLIKAERSVHDGDTNTWHEKENITEKVIQYAGPNEDFFNTDITPMILGYSGIKLTVFDINTGEQVSKLFTFDTPLKI